MSWCLQAFLKASRNAVLVILRGCSRTGLGEKNPLSPEYRDHLRKYVPTLRSYGLQAAADFYQTWADGNLVPSPLLDTSAWLGASAQPLNCARCAFGRRGGPADRPGFTAAPRRFEPVPNVLKRPVQCPF